MAVNKNPMLYYDYTDEETLFVPQISDARYDVTISEIDKILSLTENGELLADIGLSYENNILKLIGKDDSSELASIELPNSLTSLEKFELSEGEDGKEIVISFLKSDGTDVSLSLNVDELATVYKAGKGLELSEDNTFSIKLKTGSLLGFGDNGELDINLQNAYPTYSEVTTEFSKYGNYINTLSGAIDTLNSEMTDLNSLFNGTSENVSGIQQTLASLNDITSKIEALEAKDEEYASTHTDLDNKIEEVSNDVNTLETSMATILPSALANDDTVKTTLESAINTERNNRISNDEKLSQSITQANTDCEARIEEVKALIPTDYVSKSDHEQWEAKIKNLVDISQWIDENGDVVNTGKIISICSDVDNLGTRVTTLETKDNALDEEISALSAISNTLSAECIANVNALNAEIDVRKEQDEMLSNEILALNSSASTLDSRVDILVDAVQSISGNLISTEEFENVKSVVGQDNQTLRTVVQTNDIQAEAITANSTQVEKNKADIAKNATLITSLNNTVSALSETITTTYKQELQDISDRVSDLENSYATLNTKIDNILERLTALENKM